MRDKIYKQIKDDVGKVEFYTIEGRQITPSRLLSMMDEDLGYIPKIKESTKKEAE